MRQIYLSILLILFNILLYRCTSSKPLDSSMAALQAARESQETSLRTLALISEQANKSEKEGGIAESANAEIQVFVASESSRIKAQQEALDAARAEAEEFKKGKSKKNQQKVLDQMNQAVMNSTSEIRILDKKTAVVVDFLGNFTFSKSEIGALFSPGEYHLIPEQIKEGEKLFTPIVEKLFTFSNKHKQSYKDLRGEIIVTGYSDATPVDKGSRLYKDLTRRLESDNGVTNEPQSGQLNQKLSELRAVAVKQLLDQIITKRNANAAVPLNISVKILGRGEELPRGLPLNISKNDSRRRVVTFYWVVLPEL